MVKINQKIIEGKSIDLERLVKGTLFRDSYEDWSKKDFIWTIHQGRTIKDVFDYLDEFNSTSNQKYIKKALRYLSFFGNNFEKNRGWFIPILKGYKSKNDSGVACIGNCSSDLIHKGYGGHKEWINIDSYILAGRLANELNISKLSENYFKKGYEFVKGFEESLAIYGLGPMSTAIEIWREINPHKYKREFECITGAKIEDKKIVEKYNKYKREFAKKGLNLQKATRMNPKEISVEIILNP